MGTPREPCDPAPDAPPSVTDFVDELVVSLAALRIQDGGAGSAPDVARALERTLERLLADAGRERLELGLERGYLVHDGRALLGATLSGARLLTALERLGARGVAFERGASAAEFLALARVLEHRPRGGRELAQALLELRSSGCTRVTLTCGGAEPERVRAPLRELEPPARFYQRLVDHLQEVTVCVCRREAFSLEPTRHLAATLVGRVEREPGALFSLSRYERFDAFTFGHSIRVALLALEFARAHTRDTGALTRLGLAALMHDVGKAWLPFEVLYASGRLDEQARATMELHAQHGGALLAAMDADPLCVAVAFGHHLRHAGGGYPATAHAPPLSAATRLVKICDVFEALTAPRPHRAALAPPRAYRIMLAMTGHFDPRLLRRFVEIHGVHPVGTCVRLSSGETARVAAQSRLLDRPRVVLTSAADGSPIAADPDALVDLSDDRERDLRRIVAALDPPGADVLAA